MGNPFDCQKKTHLQRINKLKTILLPNTVPICINSSVKIKGKHQRRYVKYNFYPFFQVFWRPAFHNNNQPHSPCKIKPQHISKLLSLPSNLLYLFSVRIGISWKLIVKGWLMLDCQISLWVLFFISKNQAPDIKRQDNKALQPQFSIIFNI